MPSVCGSPLTFTSSTLYPTNSLHLASVSKQTNLTRVPTLSKASQPFTKKNEDNALNKVTRLNDISTPHSYPASNTISNLNMHGPQYPRITPNGNSTQSTDQGSVNIPPKAPITKPYVPVFTKRKLVKELSKKILPKVGELRKEKPLVPCFGKSVSKSKPSRGNPMMNVKSSSSGVAKVVSRDGSNIVKPSSNGNIVSVDGSRIDSPSSSNKGMVVSRDRLSLCLSKKHVGGRNMLNGVTQPTEQREGIDILNGPSQKTDERGVTILSRASQFTDEREACSILSVASYDRRIESHLVSERSNPSLVEQNQFFQKQCPVSLKKKEPKPDIDVRKMVAENKLSKVNATAITKWLKSEGVKCKCKEKKQELMIKVYQHLGLVQPEP